jgi:ferric-dicitrate binding protein FerR (iron transport regulator)
MTVRERTIKLSEEEYVALRRAQKELAAIKDRRMTRAIGPPMPSGTKTGRIDWGGVALGAVAAMGALALLKWIGDQSDKR